LSTTACSPLPTDSVINDKHEYKGTASNTHDCYYVQSLFVLLFKERPNVAEMNQYQLVYFDEPSAGLLF
jgi:hypothetical protein